MPNKYGSDIIPQPNTALAQSVKKPAVYEDRLMALLRAATPDSQQDYEAFVALKNEIGQKAKQDTSAQAALLTLKNLLHPKQFLFIADQNLLGNPHINPKQFANLVIQLKTQHPAKN